MASRRIHKELQDLQHSSPICCYVSQDINDVISWFHRLHNEVLFDGYIRQIKALNVISICHKYYPQSNSNFRHDLNSNHAFQCYGAMVAPSNSVYCGGIFFFTITFPTDYPFKPFKFHFITKIYHCNVTNNGEMLLDLLSPSMWSPPFNISMIIFSIRQLLSAPNTENSLNINPSLLTVYQTNTMQYNNTCQQWTQKYASLTEINPKFYTQKITSQNINGSINGNCIKFKSITDDTQEKMIQIFVKSYCGKMISLNMNTDAMIRNIKQQISHKEDIFWSEQRLFYQGIELKNERTLYFYNIEEESILQLVVLGQKLYSQEQGCDTAACVIKNKQMEETDVIGELLSGKLVSLVTLSTLTDTEKDICNGFWSKMSKHDYRIMSLLKVERNYQKNISRFEKNQNEELLFHGTSVENGANIVFNGFDSKFNINSAYGKGTYFAKNADKAAKYSLKKSYSGYYLMLVCRVIIGKCTDKASLYQTRNEYDSFVNSFKYPSIYVINKDCHALPVYIILFMPLVMCETTI